MEQYTDILLLGNNIFRMQKLVYIVIPALLHQMEKFQLSVGLNNGWLCNTVRSQWIQYRKKQQNAARHFHFKHVINDSAGSEGT